MELSIVIPLFNERDNLGPLHEELDARAAASGRFLRNDIRGRRQYRRQHRRAAQIKSGGYECARDFAWRAIRDRPRRSRADLHQAAGDVVVAMDADGENDPADIPRLLAKLDEGYDLVSGWRTERWQERTAYAADCRRSRPMR